MSHKLHLSVVALLAVSSLSFNAMGEEKRIYASVYSTNEWKEYPGREDVGMYSFSMTEYDREAVKLDSDLEASAGGVMTEDFYFCTKETNYGSWVDVTHYTFKPETFEFNSQTFGSAQGVATDLAYNHVTAKIYGCFTTDPDLGEEEGGYVFGTLNEGNGERFAIRSLDVPWIALGCSRSGQLYAVGMDGVLWKVNSTNGDMEQIADLGFTASRRSTGAIDTSTGIFYVVCTNDDDSTYDELGYNTTHSVLYAVDVNAGTAEQVYEFGDGEALGGMYIPGPIADDNAPASATDVEASFEAGSLNGTISFTVPDTTFGGDALEGDITYLVRASGSLFAQGTSAPGERVVANGRVYEDGEYEFAIELRNAVGKGPVSKLSMWVGHDTPVKLSAASLSYADGAFHLSWDAPVATEHGGYMNPSLITYEVTRHPDETVVANGVECSVIDPVAMPEDLTGYSYSIAMSYRGVAVNTYTTPVYKLGTVKLPYTLDFDDENSFEYLTVIDANGDRNEWYREEYWYIEAEDLECTAALYPYSLTNKADDWLILPAISFESGKTYKLDFQVSTASESSTERLAVYYGSAPSAEGMTDCLMEATEYAIFEPVEESIEFSTSESGYYNIGFYACSDADGSGMGLRNISVSQKETSGGAVVDSEASASAFYTLQGVKIERPTSSGIYIRRASDGTVSKVIK